MNNFTFHNTTVHDFETNNLSLSDLQWNSIEERNAENARKVNNLKMNNLKTQRRYAVDPLTGFWNVSSYYQSLTAQHQARYKEEQQQQLQQAFQIEQNRKRLIAVEAEAHRVRLSEFREDDYQVCVNAHAASVKHDAASDIGIFGLAPEIRNRIYELALPRGRIVTNTSDSRLQLRVGDRSESFQLAIKGVKLSIEPALLRTCKQMREEAKEMYYAGQNIRFVYLTRDGASPIADLKAFVAKLGPKRFGLAPVIEIYINSSLVELKFWVRGKKYSGKGHGSEDWLRYHYDEILKIVRGSGDRTIEPPDNRPAFTRGVPAR